MASNSTKSFLADAGYGEQELDANSALMELDKGLRSGKLGEQCEAVVRFPGFSRSTRSLFSSIQRS